MNTKVRGIVCEHGINDMSKEWMENNKKIYTLWSNLIKRIYDEKIHKKHPTYINATLQIEFHWLSYFAEHIKEIDGYNEEKFLNGELQLDKDIKSDGKNKEYSIENCMFVSARENTKQAMKTRDNSYLQKENHPMYGKHHSEESKQKMSKAKKESGSSKGKNNPKSKTVIQYDEKMNIIKIWDYAKQISEELSINYGTLKSHLQKKSNKPINNYIFRYKTIRSEEIEE